MDILQAWRLTNGKEDAVLNKKKKGQFSEQNGLCSVHAVYVAYASYCIATWYNGLNIFYSFDSSGRIFLVFQH
jgi:hypothetical protein